MPSEEEEKLNPEGADQAYAAAADVLRPLTNDRKALPFIFKELVAYGFNRNAYGSRWVGLVVAAMTVVATLLHAGTLHLQPLYWTDSGLNATRRPDTGLVRLCGPHAGLAHPGVLHSTYWPHPNSAVLRKLRHDGKIQFFREQLLSQGDAGIDIGFDQNTWVVHVDHAYELGKPGHRGEFGDADAQPPFDDLRSLEAFDDLVALGEDPLRNREHLKVRDICHGDQVATRAAVMQHKTQRPVQFEITPATREAVQK